MSDALKYASKMTLSLEELEKRFQELGNVAVTRGHCEQPGCNNFNDMAWNHMDQLHRPFVHKTYTQSLRVALDRGFALSLTYFPFLGIRFFVLVTDVLVRPGVFYQAFNLFSIIYFHVMISVVAEGRGTAVKADWFIVSHPFFKFLHSYLDKRYKNIWTVQNAQDQPIRDQRQRLREKNFKFVDGDKLDYLTANQLTSNIRFPQIPEEIRVSLSDCPASELKKISAGPIDLLVRREGASFLIWTAVCPHEGGPLDQGTVCKTEIECPWHGLKFHGLTLSAQHPKGRLADMELRLENETLGLKTVSLPQNKDA